VRGHADAATLAAFREELLSQRKTAQVSAHLAACPRCAALDAQLAEVTVLLTHAAAPPMPDSVTARIEVALAAEAAARGPAPVTDPIAAGTAAPGTGGHDGTRGTAGRDATRGAGSRRPGWASRGRSRPALRVATVAAAVAVIAGGGYTVAQLLSGSPAVHGTTASGASAGRAKAALPRSSTGGLRSGAGNMAPSAVTGPVRVVSSGTNYQPAQLAAQASTLLKTLGPKNSPVHPGPSLATPPNGYLAQFPGLQACAAHIAGTQHALLADVARYRGHPAAIIILPAPPGGRSKAVVVAPGCTATTSRVLATAFLPAPR
jgi:anti-sigma factor RsiW